MAKPIGDSHVREIDLTVADAGIARIDAACRAFPLISGDPPHTRKVQRARLPLHTSIKHFRARFGPCFVPFCSQRPIVCICTVRTSHMTLCTARARKFERFRVTFVRILHTSTRLNTPSIPRTRRPIPYLERVGGTESPGLATTSNNASRFP